MSVIDRENVENIFLRICDEEEELSYDDLIDRAIAKIEQALTVETLTPAQAASCEYAAACEAAYEYALEAASAQRLMMSAKGSLLKESVGSKAVAAADGLRKHAFAELAGFAVLGGFVFEATGGSR